MEGWVASGVDSATWVSGRGVVHVACPAAPSPACRGGLGRGESLRQAFTPSQPPPASRGRGQARSAPLTVPALPPRALFFRRVAAIEAARRKRAAPELLPGFPYAAVRLGRKGPQGTRHGCRVLFDRTRMSCRKARPSLTDSPGRSPASAASGCRSLYSGLLPSALRASFAVRAAPAAQWLLSLGQARESDSAPGRGTKPGPTGRQSSDDRSAKRPPSAPRQPSKRR
jgi:hypothetical protein